MQEALSTQYNFGLPASYVFSLLEVDLEADDLGPFDLSRVHETKRGFLEAELLSAPLRMLGHHFYFISEEREAKMTPAESVELLIKLFTDPSTGQLADPTIVRAAESSAPGGYELFQYRMQDIKRAVD